jgi:hypothetical protein
MPARKKLAAPTLVRRRTAASERLIERVRKICMALPEATEKLSHGEPTWFAGKGKVFASIDDHHHGAPHCSVWLPQPLGVQEALCDAQPERFFRPPYVGHRGWLGVRLDRDLPWDDIAGAIEDAYLTVAPKSLIEAAGLAGDADAG